MQKKDFYYILPPELIAQTPATPRDSSRLLYLSRSDGSLRHYRFHQLPQLLAPGDLLVLNSSKVLPARLLGNTKGNTGLRELLLLRQVDGDSWECLARPGRRIRVGDVLEFGDGSLSGTVLDILSGGTRLVRFSYNTATLYEKLDQFGSMPLPPYIHTQLKNNADYQTVYAKTPGSAAAPTAGLHFTAGLLAALQDKGIATCEVTLHVGLGTFRPVQEDEIENHKMHAEWYSIDEAAANAINRTRENGGRVIAVGTTSCRTLESAMLRDGQIRACSGETDIFIHPGYQFKAIDGLITNFHLPESTLIMLVSAFAGHQNTMQAYQEAIRQQYRFFSFGDAMIVL